MRGRLKDVAWNHPRARGRSFLDPNRERSLVTWMQKHRPLLPILQRERPLRPHLLVRLHQLPILPRLQPRLDRQASSGAGRAIGEAVAFIAAANREETAARRLDLPLAGLLVVGD